MEYESIKKKDGWGEVIRVGVFIFLFSAAWLYLRRFGAPLEEVYVKLLFASLPVTGVFLIGMSFAIGPLARFFPAYWAPRLPLRKQYGLGGFFLVAAHVLWGIVRLSPAYIFSLFGNILGTQDVVAISMILGFIGFLLFFFPAAASLSWISKRITPNMWRILQRIGYLAFALGIAHFTLLKWEGWTAFSSWPYGLPPLSLLLFVFVVAVFAVRACALFLPKRGL